MAQVLTFPGTKRPEQVSELADAEVRQESQIDVQPEKPAEVAKSPVFVRVRADVFQDMLNSLVFYARFGWDEGKKARKVMDDVVAPEAPVA